MMLNSAVPDMFRGRSLEMVVVIVLFFLLRE